MANAKSWTSSRHNQTSPMHTHLGHSLLCLISSLLSLSSSLSRCICLYAVLLSTRHSRHDLASDSHTLSHGNSQEEEDHKDLVSSQVRVILCSYSSRAVAEADICARERQRMPRNNSLMFCSPDGAHPSLIFEPNLEILEISEFCLISLPF
jgi:hypothetical protein